MPWASEESVCGRLFEQKNRGQGGAARGSYTGIAMPWSAIHPKLAIFFSNDDAVIAKKLDAGFGHPQAGSGALAGTRMTQEKVAGAIVVREPQSMYFDALSKRQPVHHGEFIDGVFQRKYGLVRSETIPPENDVATFKRRIEPRCFVGMDSERRARKIKLIPVAPMYADHKPPEAKEGVGAGIANSCAQETSNSMSQTCFALSARTKG